MDQGLGSPVLQLGEPSLRDAWVSSVAAAFSRRSTLAPYGLFGGHPGKRAETLLIRDGQTDSFGSNEMVELRGSDVVSFRLASAGGDGGPRERDGDAVRDDVADGCVSEGAAREVHDVDIDGGD